MIILGGGGLSDSAKNILGILIIAVCVLLVWNLDFQEDDWLTLVISLAIVLVPILIYVIPAIRRAFREEEKFGRELTPAERKRIREIGEESWVYEQTGADGISVHCHYTDYKERQKKATKKEDIVTANKKGK